MAAQDDRCHEQQRISSVCEWTQMFTDNTRMKQSQEIKYREIFHCPPTARCTWQHGS